MGRKNNKLANRDEKAAIRIQSIKLTFEVRILRISHNSRHDTTRAINSMERAA